VLASLFPELVLQPLPGATHNGKQTGGQASFFLQDKMQLTSSFTLDLGVRFDRYSLAISESHVSPRLNAAYRFPSRTVLFGSYNHFYLPPPIENVLASSAGLTAFVSEVGRPLPPGRSIKENQFELGVTHHAVPGFQVLCIRQLRQGKAYGMEIKSYCSF
jgi:outer membrane receptor protein involved in Fe transport